MPRPTVVTALCLVFLCGAGALVAAENSDPWGVVRGVTISTHTDGRDWADDRMTPTMREIRNLGANWITIHPYAGISSDGSVRFRKLDPQNPPASITRPIREAHALGLKIMIKPHLAYWGSPFRWRGEIGFETQARWERFWSSYREWIVGLSLVSGEADAFVVGTELGRTLGFEKQWRQIVRDVRGNTSAPLTYAANWDTFEDVPFWNALDAIGIQAYFPLTEDGAEPTEAALRAGWESWMKRVRVFSRAEGRPVLFTELGYNRSLSAAARPWEAKLDGDEARSTQRACMRAALRAVEGESAVVGAFLWKWFPLPRPVGRTFQLATPEMRNVISMVWRGEPVFETPEAPGLTTGE